MASNSSTYYLDRRNRKKKRKSSKMEDEYDSKKSRLDLDLSHKYATFLNWLECPVDFYSNENITLDYLFKLFAFFFMCTSKEQ